jgi:putative SOS response-associated peptidase YedK
MLFCRPRGPDLPKTTSGSFTCGFVDPIPNLEPRYVVRPTDVEQVVAICKDGARHFPAMRWGLVLPGSPDIKTGLTLFNARAETILQKRGFADPFTERSC